MLKADSGRPNNIAISRDGRRVYVAIIEAPGAVDVIDTASQERAKSIPTKGGVHNTYLTPDGRYVVAGSIAGKNLTVIDVQTEQPVWSLEFDLDPTQFPPGGNSLWGFRQGGAVVVFGLAD